MKHEVTQLDRSAQVVLQSHAALCVDGELARVKFEAALAVVLCRVHRAVGSLHQRLRILAIAGKQRYAYAGSRSKLSAGNGDGLGNHC